MIVKVTACYVHVVLGSLWSKERNLKVLKNDWVIHTTGTVGEWVRRRNNVIQRRTLGGMRHFNLNGRRWRS